MNKNRVFQPFWCHDTGRVPKAFVISGQTFPEVVGDENFSWTRRLLDPVGDIHRTSHDSILHARLGSYVSDHPFSDVKAETELDRGHSLLLSHVREILDPFSDRKRTGQGAFRMGLRKLRDAEDDHDSVAHDVVDRSLMKKDLVDEGIEVVVQDLDHLLGRKLARKPGEVADVGEDEHHLLPDPSQMDQLGMVDQVFGNIGRDVPDQCLFQTFLVLHFASHPVEGDDEIPRFVPKGRGADPDVVPLENSFCRITERAYGPGDVGGQKKRSQKSQKEAPPSQNQEGSGDFGPDNLVGGVRQKKDHLSHTHPLKLDWIGKSIQMVFLQVPEDETLFFFRPGERQEGGGDETSASGRGDGIIFDAPLKNPLPVEDIDAEDTGRVFEHAQIVLEGHPVVLEEWKREGACQLKKKEPVVFCDLVLSLVKNLVFQKDISESQGDRKDQDRKKQDLVEEGNSQKFSVRQLPGALRRSVMKFGKMPMSRRKESVHSMEGGAELSKIRVGPILLAGGILLAILCGLRSGPPFDPRPAPSLSGAPESRLVSVEDLRRSEEFLRKDLGLENGTRPSTMPLWEHSLRAHPFLVLGSSLLFLGGIVASVIIFRRQNRLLEEGLAKLREQEAGRGSGVPGPAKAPASLQSILEKERNEIEKLPAILPEKALRKVDTVLDTLRQALGAGLRNSRISLFRYDEKEAQFRICGFSNGPEFQILNTAVFFPAEIMGLPLRVLSPFQKKEGSWIFPFVVDSGAFCAILLEMGSGVPPNAWTESIQESMPLIKALIARQESEREDASLTTRDSSGSLDYRATMNRLLEEWSRTRRLGVPFSVIALQIDNLPEVERYYGTGPLERAWSRITGSIAAILRATDWIMRPQEDLLMIQILEAGPTEGRAVMGRIAKELSRHGQSENLEKGLHYRGILISYSPESAPSIHTFLDQIQARLSERTDFEGTFFHA